MIVTVAFLTCVILKQCRDEVALRRLADSSKMWSTLKKIAEAELADSTSKAADFVTLRFLSLAPRVARLNQAVHVGLVAGSSAKADADIAGGLTDAADSAVDAQHLPQSRGKHALR